METIQVQVSSDLAARLRPYQDLLPRILEWGLRHIEGEDRLGPPANSDDESKMAALRSTGLVVDLDPAIAARYRAGSAQKRRTPLKVDGRPLSELIIEARDRRWTNKA